MWTLVLYLSGASLVVLGVVVELAWLGICFGSVILGLVLLLFAPGILIFPLVSISGIGLALISTANQDIMIIKRQDYNSLLLQENKIDDVFDGEFNELDEYKTDAKKKKYDFDDDDIPF